MTSASRRRGHRRRIMTREKDGMERLRAREASRRMALVCITKIGNIYKVARLLMNL
jgi:hypothetical protein